MTRQQLETCCSTFVVLAATTHHSFSSFSPVVKVEKFSNRGRFDRANFSTVVPIHSFVHKLSFVYSLRIVFPRRSTIRLTLHSARKDSESVTLFSRARQPSSWQWSNSPSKPSMVLIKFKNIQDCNLPVLLVELINILSLKIQLQPSPKGALIQTH